MLYFAAGEMEKSILVPVLNDTIKEQDETFSVALNSLSGGYRCDPDTATVTIIDDDSALPDVSPKDVSLTLGATDVSTPGAFAALGEGASGVLTASADIQNNSDKARDVTLVLALYNSADGANKLIGISYSSQHETVRLLEPGATKTYSASLDVSLADTSGCSVKVFVWDTLAGQNSHTQAMIF